MLGGSLCPSGTLSHGKGCLSSTVWDYTSCHQDTYFLSSLCSQLLLGASLPPHMCCSLSPAIPFCPAGPLWVWNSQEESLSVILLFLSLGTYENHPSGGALFFDPFSFLLSLRDFLQASLSYCKQLGFSITQWPNLAHSFSVLSCGDNFCHRTNEWSQSLVYLNFLCSTLPKVSYFLLSTLKNLSSLWFICSLLLKNKCLRTML